MTATGKSFPPLTDAAKKKSLSAIRQFAGALPPLHLDVPVTPGEVERISRSLEEFCENLTASATLDMQRANNYSEDGVTLLTAAVLRDPFSETASTVTSFPISPFPPFDATQMPPRPSAAVRMKHKQAWNAHKQSLPVYNHRSAILSAVRSSKVTTVVAGRQSGKSTQVPQLLFDTDLYKKKRVIVVCGSDVAAVSLAERLREEIGLDEGHIAHCILGDIRCCSGTQLVVTTPYVLCKLLVCDPLLSEVGAIVVDDPSVRSIYLDLCFALLRELFSAYTHVVSLGAQAHQRLPTSIRAAVQSLEKLALIVLCHDDLTESQISKYFQQPPQLFADHHGAAQLPSDGTAATISIAREVVPDKEDARTSAISLAPLMLVDDAIHWLKRCETTNSNAKPPKIPADVAAELTAVYSDDIQCLTQIQLAEDAAGEMSVQSDKMYWWDLSAKLLCQYNLSDASEEPMAAVVVVLPSPAHVILGVERLQAALEACRAPSSSGSSIHIIRYLENSDTSTAKMLLRAYADASAAKQRLVILSTPQILLTCMPLTNVGLVLDWARTQTRTFDLHVEADREAVEVVSKTQLRHRRMLRTSAKGNPSLAVQFVTRAAMHAANRIRQDTAHPFLHMCQSEWLDLFRVLRGVGGSAVTILVSSSSTTSGSNASKMHHQRLGKLLSSLLVDLPSNAIRQDQLTRISSIAESHLVNASELSDQTLKLTPFGACCLALPFTPQAARCILLGSVLDELPLASVLATACNFHSFTSDLFSTIVPSQATEEIQEARRFFRLDDDSDFSTVLNFYRMWLQTKREGSQDDVAELLQASHVAAAIIDHFHAMAQNLFNSARKILFSNSAAGSSDNMKKKRPSVQLADFDASVAAAFADSNLDEYDDQLTLSGMASTAFLPLLRDVVTMSLYPNLAVVEGGDGVAVVRPIASATADGSTPAVSGQTGLTAPVPAAFHFTSAVGAQRSAAQTAFVYGERVGNAGNDASLSILSRSAVTVPGAILLCGSGQLTTPAATRRCRGWLPPVTTAWRDTRPARSLPPTSNIAPKPVQGLLHDPSASTSVALVLDHSFAVSMGRCTAELVIKIRKSLLRRIQSIALGESRADDDGPVNEIRSCLVWLHNREARCEAFLRERRGLDAVTRRSVTLFPFLNFKHEPGQLPERISDAVVNASIASAAATAAPSGEQAPAVLEMASPAVNNGNTYTGKEPTNEVKTTVLHTARTIGKVGSRRKEAELLKSGAAFAFLDPLNEFHEYYIHILRKEAPHLDWLGDDLEELELYLQNVEKEVVEELNQQQMLQYQQQQQQATDQQQYGSTGGLLQQPQGPAGPSGNTFSAYFEGAGGDAGSQHQGDFYNNGGDEYQQQQQHPDRYHYLSSSADEGADGGHLLNPQMFVGNGQNREGAVLGSTERSRVHDGLLAVPQQPQQQQQQYPGSLGGGAGLGFLPIPSLTIGGAGATPADLPIVTVSTAHAGGPTTSTGSNIRFLSQQDQQSSMSGSLMEKLLSMRGGPQAAAPPPPPPPPPPLQEQQQSNDMPSLFHGFQPPPAALQQPSTDDLLALFKTPIVSIPQRPHPLSIPPPPIPADVLANRPPSVLITPIPNKDPTLNIPLILAKALGEKMGVKVGPTLIVGDVARIDVPNHSVERRAIALETFFCLGQEIKIFANNRIIDNPNGVHSRKMRFLKEKLKDDVPRHLERVKYSPEKSDAAPAARFNSKYDREPPSQHGAQGTGGGYTPATFGRGGGGMGWGGRGGRGGAAGFANHTAAASGAADAQFQQQQQGPLASKLGVVSDSDDDDDDDSDSSSSSSSASSDSN